MIPTTPVLPHSPVKLKEIPIAENQPEYLTLPALVGHDHKGIVTSRWQLTWQERVVILFGGNIWLQQLAFGQPVQPVKLSATEPDAAECM